MAKYRKYLWYYIAEFSALMLARLTEKHLKYHDKWKELPREGQEDRIVSEIIKYFEGFQETGRPINWIDVANLALIGWVREQSE